MTTCSSLASWVHGVWREARSRVFCIAMVAAGSLLVLPGPASAGTVAHLTTNPVAVVFPNGGEMLFVWNDAHLVWTPGDGSFTASLSISTDEGVTFIPIASDLPNTGGYDWFITPDFATNHGDCEPNPLFKAMFKVELWNAGVKLGEDVSDAMFAIYQIPEHADPPPEVSIVSAAVTEGNSGQTIVTLSVVKSGYAAVSVDYATADGTATVANHDYLPASGSLAFGVYPSTQTISLVVEGDLAQEPDEAFTVGLSTTSCYANVYGPATVTIVDDDRPRLFGSPTRFETGFSPYGVSVGDLNGDGKIDVVTANNHSDASGHAGSTVSVLLGDGAGGFGVKRDFTTGPSPISVAIGDLNGDGKPDLAVANLDANSVSVLLANGSGGFGPKTDYGVGQIPMAVAVADLNADGRLDLVVVNFASNSVSVMIGNGTGTFGLRTDYATGGNPVALAIGDLNRDGVLDMAVANSYSGNISVLLGNGSGGFGAKTDFPAGYNPGSVAIGDLNNDHKPDLATVNTSLNDRVSVLLAIGNGSFGPSTDFPTGGQPASLAIGDLNEDGAPDLMVANESTSDGVSALLGHWDGSFATNFDFRTAEACGSIALADLNGDAAPDVVAANQNGSSVTVFLNIRPFSAVAVEPRTPVSSFDLLSVQPSPTRAGARIDFAVARAARLRLTVTDVQGRRVAVLADEVHAPGRHQVVWDGRSEGGRAPAGVYFVRYEWPGAQATKRLVVLP